MKSSFFKILRITLRLLNYLFYSLSMFFLLIAILSGLVCITTASWDSLVWLFNADWRTSEFKLALNSFISCFVSSGLYKLSALLNQGVIDEIFCLDERQSN